MSLWLVFIPYSGEGNQWCNQGLLATSRFWVVKILPLSPSDVELFIGDQASQSQSLNVVKVKEKEEDIEKKGDIELQFEESQVSMVIDDENVDSQYEMENETLDLVIVKLKVIWKKI